MRADGQDWTNRSTWVVYRQLLTDYSGDELAEAIAEWERDYPGQDFIPLLAEQLAEDLHEEHVDAWDEDTHLFVATACEILLSRVDWLQVASRLVEHVAGTLEPILVHAAEAAEPGSTGSRETTSSPRVACESPMKSRQRERMDADTLFAAARTLERLALQRAPSTLARIHERALRRRASLVYDLAQHMDLSDEPELLRRTVWRTKHRPRVVHWLVGGIAAAGQQVAYEDRDWAACGKVRLGISAHERGAGHGPQWTRRRLPVRTAWRSSRRFRRKDVLRILFDFRVR